MRHIVIVSSSGELGGAELSLLPIIEALADRTHVTLMSPAPGPLEEAACRRGASLSDGFRLSPRVRASSGLYGSGGVKTGAVALGDEYRLARQLRRLHPDLVYCNGTRAQVGATAPARAASAHVAWHVRDFARGGAIGRAWRSLAVVPAVIIANSHATAEQPALRHVRRRVSAIPNGIDLAAFRLRAATPTGAPTVGMVAHLTPWKGHARFLRVVAHLRTRYPELRARIAGAGHYDTAGNGGLQAGLQRLIAELGLSAMCRIEHVPPAVMPVWLSSLSVLVHCPDDPEPFGRALAEAMAVGVPVVASAAGGALEVVGEAALIVMPHDDEAIAEAVSVLLTDRAMCTELSRLGRKRVEEHYTEGRYVTATVAALERVWLR